jgi:hypothetical protein
MLEVKVREMVKSIISDQIIPIVNKVVDEEVLNIDDIVMGIVSSRLNVRAAEVSAEVFSSPETLESIVVVGNSAVKELESEINEDLLHFKSSTQELPKLEDLSKSSKSKDPAKPASKKDKPAEKPQKEESSDDFDFDALLEETSSPTERVEKDHSSHLVSDNDDIDDFFADLV